MTCIFLPDEQQIANEECFCQLKSKNEIFGILWFPQTIVTENTIKSQIIYLWLKNDRCSFNLKITKIIISLWFNMQWHIMPILPKNNVNINKTNIDHSL